jgi:glycosyltransferase involved in cell wall biosynthesis/2-polyprenyl-3-methyl-5-hydroxy-6-metoxy-1,4-benzoquinol methylase
MPSIYQHQYEPISVYGNVVSLLRGKVSRVGVHLDIGCGYGAIAEPLRDELDLTYIGFDIGEDGLEALRGRSFEAHRIDLADIQRTELILREAVGGRPVASITLIDTLEHITNGEDVLILLRRVAETTDAPLVLSVPNVTHKDLALKLLTGRWDVTEAGLLDHTHVSLYSHARLSRLMTAVGWHEIASRDWLLQHSDQQFPTSSPVLNHQLPIGQFLLGLINQANPHALANQFVRLYQICSPRPLPLLVNRTEPEVPFLSIVLTVTDQATPHLRKILDRLTEQTSPDFELVIALCGPSGSGDGAAAQPRPELSRSLSDRTSFLAATGTRADILNIAVAQCRARYFSILDDVDGIDLNWVASLAAASERVPGAVLQLRAETIANGSGGFRTAALPETEFSPMPYRLAGVEHGRFVSLAIPSGVFHELGIRFGVELADRGGWDLVLEAIVHCGLHVASPAGETQSGGDARALVAIDLFDPDYISLLSKLNGRPLLLPSGSAEAINRLAKLDADNRELIRRLAKLDTDNRELIQSTEKLDNSFKEISNLLGARPALAMFLNTFLSKLARLAGHRNLVQTDSPFLSVITRTRGIRPHTLRDTLMSLAGQSSQDFEMIIVIHNAAESVLDNIQQLACEFPPSFRDRVRVIACNRPGRSSPLNDAVQHASGAYIVALDDDDIVFAHWVETFKKLAAGSPGSLVRATCVKQDIASVCAGRMPSRPWAVSWFSVAWPRSYDAVAHLHANYTPNMSIAFPAEVFREDGLWFDETLETTEDWDLMTRAAMSHGVASTSEITAIYRWWTNAESTQFTHPPEQWAANTKRVHDKFNSQPLMLPPESARRIISLIESEHSQAAKLHQCTAKLHQRDERIGELEKAMRQREEVIVELTSSLDNIRQSTIWRAAGPVRAIAHLLKPSHLKWLRRTIKLGYWVLTPHRIPERLRFIRGRHSQHQQ